MSHAVEGCALSRFPVVHPQPPSVPPCSTCVSRRQIVPVVGSGTGPDGRPPLRI
ncbi:hypothetical protein JOC24_006231 [Streptomyces sp. HB132]|nr:hypothetical protein [Streptomyces sp. HB132]